MRYARLYGVKSKQKKKSGRCGTVLDALRIRVAQSAQGDGLGSEVGIAKECGVSRMTARKAVNALIAEGLVERRAGVGIFVRGKDVVTRRFAFVAGNLLWDKVVQMASSARKVMQENGAELVLRDSHGEEDEYLAELEALPSSEFDGALVASMDGERSDEAIRKLAATGFPVAVIDQSFKDVPIVSVASDNLTGGVMAARVLISAGHRELGFIGDFDAETVRFRWEGFRATALGSGLKLPSVYKIRGVGRLASWEESVCGLVKRILALKRPPTAFFCSCDAVARFAMRTIAASGLSVPGDISLVGFDDDPIAEWTSPALTTIRQDFYAMGHEAAKRLLAFGRLAPSEKSCAIPVSLVERGSVGRMNKRRS